MSFHIPLYWFRDSHHRSRQPPISWPDTLIHHPEVQAPHLVPPVVSKGFAWPIRRWFLWSLDRKATVAVEHLLHLGSIFMDSAMDVRTNLRWLVRLYALETLGDIHKLYPAILLAPFDSCSMCWLCWLGLGLVSTSWLHLKLCRSTNTGHMKHHNTSWANRVLSLDCINKYQQ